VTEVPARDLRPFVLAAEKLTGVDQLRALANVRDQTQRLEDRLLLALLDQGSAAELGRALGISRQAVTQRADHARRRQEQP
jgi:hypothetical protein